MYRLCTIPGCGRKHYGQGYCSPHYQMWKYRGRPENWRPSPDLLANPFNWEKSRQVVLQDIPAIIIPYSLYRPSCRVTGCDKAPDFYGFCLEHYQTLEQCGCLEDWTLAIRQRFCKYPDCANQSWVNGLCIRCYRRWEKDGLPERWLYQPKLVFDPRCLALGCGEKHHAKGRCKVHYLRHRRKKTA